jgi:hypothetical protein
MRWRWLKGGHVDVAAGYMLSRRMSNTMLDLREGAQRDSLLYLQVQVLSARLAFPVKTRNFVR